MNTVSLRAYQEAQELLNSSEVQEAVTDLVEEEIMDIESRRTKEALEACADKFFSFMEMQDIDVDSASVSEVMQLARLAQDLKTDLDEKMRDIVEPEAIAKVKASKGLF